MQHVFLDGDADLQNLRIFEDRKKHGNAAAVVESEKVGAFFAAKLNERRQIAVPAGEARTRFRVEAENLFFHERGDGLARALFIDDHFDSTPVLKQGQGGDEVFVDMEQTVSGGAGGRRRRVFFGVIFFFVCCGARGGFHDSPTVIFRAAAGNPLSVPSARCGA